MVAPTPARRAAAASGCRRRPAPGGPAARGPTCILRPSPATAPSTRCAVVVDGWQGDRPRRRCRAHRPGRGRRTRGHGVRGHAAVPADETSAAHGRGAEWSCRRPRMPRPARRTPGRRASGRSGTACPAAERVGLAVSRGARGSGVGSGHSRSVTSCVRLVRRDRRAALGDGVGHHAALVAHAARSPRRTQHQRRLAVLAQVAGQPPPERDQRVLAHAVRRREQPALRAARATTSWAKMPSATNSAGSPRSSVCQPQRPSCAMS